MCGFLGTYNLDKRLIFSDKLIKRGPDNKKSYQDESLNLLFTRLRIVDRTKFSDQPHHSKKSILCLNGQIYNFKKISLKFNLKLNDKELQSDTAVLHAALDKHGLKILNKIEGIFSIIYYIKVTKECFLIRDSVGVKPLFFKKYDRQKFMFGSLASDISNNSNIVSEADLPFFLKWQSISLPNNRSDKLNELRPGYFLELKSGKLQKWYKDSNQKVSKVGLQKYLSKIINSQCPNDIETAVFLSGGIDSSIIAYELKSRANVRFVSLGQENDASNETSQAKRLTEDFGVELEVFNISKEEIVSSLDDFFNAMDIPTADGLNTYLLTRYIKKLNIKVGISGAGADEIFGGYSGFKKLPLIQGKFKNAKTRNYYLYKLLSKLNISDHFDNSAAFYKNFEIYQGNKYNKEVNHYTNIRNFYFENFLKPTLLRDIDHFSMFNSVEVRVPFLQSNLISLVEIFSHENDEILLGGKKRLLRDAYFDKLPKYIFQKNKTGFGIGLQNALEKEQSWLDESIFELSNFYFESKLLNHLKNESIYNYQKKNTAINFRKLWLFISFNEWNKRNAKLA